MMKKQKRSLLIVLVLLILFLIAYLWMHNYNIKHLDDDTVSGASYQVTELDSTSITQMAISDATDTSDFEKKEEQWTCVESPEEELDATAIDSMIAAAATLESDTEISEVTDYDQYGLADPAKTITLQSEEDLITIKLGDYNGTLGSYYVTINDDQPVYMLSSTVYTMLNKSLSDFVVEEETSQEAETE